MSHPPLLVAPPLRPATDLTARDLAGLLAVDTAARAAGDPPGAAARWALPLLTGDLALQWGAEQAARREGLERASAGRDGFAALAGALQELRHQTLAAALGALGLEPLVQGGVDGPDPVAAARTAFVTLYETGALDYAERVVACCPRCETVVESPDRDAGAVETQVAVVTVEPGDGAAPLAALTDTPELIEGVAAVVTPPGVLPPGGAVALPLGGRTVRVLEDPDASEPYLLVPGHRREHWELARQGGLAAPVVMTVDGTLTGGPFDGQARYAARARALEALAAEGRLADVRTARVTVERCRHCGTVLVECFGGYWILAGATVSAAAADAVHAGRVPVSPAALVGPLTDALTAAGDWCVSHQLWVGPPLPVGWCLDCGKPTVSVGEARSCGICMGGLSPDGSTFDGRFVAAAWLADVATRTGRDLTLTAPRGSGPVPDDAAGLADWVAPALGLITRLAPGAALAVAGPPAAEPAALARAAAVLEETAP